MKVYLIKRLHQLLIEIAKADMPELDKIGVELAEIEKKILSLSNVKK